MGRLKKRFNEKARQKTEVNKTNVDKNLEKSLLGTDAESYNSTQDGSNALVVASKSKDKDKSRLAPKGTSKILSKKQRKKLEKIVDQKKKKEKRADILKSLSQYQVSNEELSMYKSTSKLGQAASSQKRYEENIEDTSNITSIGKRKRKRTKVKKKKPESDMEVVPLPMEDDSSECSSSENEDVDEDNDDEIKNIEKDSNVDLLSNESEGEFVDNLDGKETSGTQSISQKENDESEEEKEEKEEEETMAKENDAFKEESASANESIKVSEKTPAVVKKAVAVKPIYVEVNRTAEIQAARLLLPILPEEQVIMEVIQENDVVVICGSTGSGKTTQVPQFLYEAGYGTHESHPGMIGITEPRRVAAVSMSKRVGEEMNMSNRKISYQIRYEGNTTDETVVKLMTDGVLLKEMENDFLLTKYSVIIIDEAHERSVYTDILIGLLSRVVPLRKKQKNPLRLIIMSATLRIEDFTENKRLFTQPPPVLKVDSRQYPVTIHFNRRTQEDYVSEAYRKVCKIHRTLKLDGGILVFLTGQNEVLALCRKLQRAFPKTNKKLPIVTSSGHKKKKKKYDDNENIEKTDEPPKKIDLDSYSTDITELSKQQQDTGYDDAEDDEDDKDLLLADAEQFNSDDDDDERSDDEMDDSAYTSAADASMPLHVLPLYSLLSTTKQAKVFVEPPEGHRLCVVATNVAETSLTIPGIKYIIDSGKVKKKFYDKVTGVSTFRIVWTSQASANQRAGRAGRVGPGHCYRLYSSAVFQNDFEEFSEPEIRRRPVDDLILQMKSMCIDKVLNFPFPTPPDSAALQSAEKLLLDLGALKNQKTKQGSNLAVISTLGRNLSKIPVSPRFAKMIYLSSKHEGCLPYIIAIVAALTVKEIFTDDIDLTHIDDLEVEDFKEKQRHITAARRKWAGEGPSSLLGDLMVILRAVGACEYAGCTEKFCSKNGLRQKAMIEIRKLRAQLTNAVNGIAGIDGVFVDPKMNPPNDKQEKGTSQDIDVKNQAIYIRQIVLSGLADHVARKVPPDEAKTLKIRNAYRCCSTDDPVYIHPTSSLFTKLPEYIVYHEIMETKKLYMKTLLTVQEDWLPVHAPHMCTFGKPLEEPTPIFCSEDDCVKAYMSCTFGPHVWPLTPRLLRYPESIECYRWFAKYLLDGDVISKLKEFSDHLLTPASVMVKSWAHYQAQFVMVHRKKARFKTLTSNFSLQPKTEKLLKTLAVEKVDTGEKLLKLWKSKPKYLLRQFLQWIPEAHHESVRMMWPPTG